mmetsp:Transcript_10318/g.30692  ORF Transcript_10318/g.30692 Transcript_10318/m.30692 type:complete len:249 (-) Transcript_10318:395-1141(-)
MAPLGSAGVAWSAQNRGAGDVLRPAAGSGVRPAPSATRDGLPDPRGLAHRARGAAQPPCTAQAALCKPRRAVESADAMSTILASAGTVALVAMVLLRPPLAVPDRGLAGPPWPPRGRDGRCCCSRRSSRVARPVLRRSRRVRTQGHGRAAEGTRIAQLAAAREGLSPARELPTARAKETASLEVRPAAILYARCTPSNTHSWRRPARRGRQRRYGALPAGKVLGKGAGGDVGAAGSNSAARGDAKRRL